MSHLPDHFVKFTREHPEVAAAHQQLGEAAAKGPLDAKTRALIKLGMAIGSGSEGAAHSQTRKALESGATAEEIRHAVMQAATTLGFPQMMAGLSWVEDVLEGSK